jgi:hypothetical protein
MKEGVLSNLEEKAITKVKYCFKKKKEAAEKSI